MSKIRGRIIALIPAIILQVLLYVLIFTILKPYAYLISIVCTILALIIVVAIVNSVEENAYKQSWMMILLIFPIFGIIFYALFGNKRTGKKLKEKIYESKIGLGYSLPESTALDEIKGKDKRFAGLTRSIQEYTGFRMYRNEGTRYYPLGEDAFPDMLEDLRSAEKYIFMEYFIIERGKFADSIFEILMDKAAHGVDVRVMYDDLGSIATFSKENVKWLTSAGIKVVVFNPIKYITLKINNRDHRKMTIIDGRIAYSGGINIADEYINEKVKHGHWKDISFRVTGDAAISYTYMFVEFWNAFSENKLSKDILIKECDNSGKDGYIMSYYENPVIDYHVTNSYYSELLEEAQDYVWFFTPYLMLGDELQMAMLKAAICGVDVRLVVPGVPDKKMVYRMTQSSYRPLLEAGVKIYEYTPGFVHAKALLTDDKIAAVGTVNLDFRSLFLHFENNSIFYESGIVKDLKADFEDMFPKCVERKLGDGGPGLRHSVVDSLLRLFSPLC